MFFIDETGHENMCDPNYPVFGFGGCAIPAAAMDEHLRQPWRKLKDDFFLGADTPLHAADLRDPTSQQLSALNQFFREGKFGRFAVTMTCRTQLPPQTVPLEVIPGALRKRWAELASHVRPTPVEVALIHEASERGDPLLQKYFGPTSIEVNGSPLKVHHGLMPKSATEALEVADFIVQAAGGQAMTKVKGRAGFRKDFRSIFHVNPLLTSFFNIDSATYDK
ncbi:MAG: hypothetical protein HQ465_18895 [Rhodospirillales bacterium]|nr:hypothetical protein [Rhodospirillales bacterium]